MLEKVKSFFGFQNKRLLNNAELSTILSSMSTSEFSFSHYLTVKSKEYPICSNFPKILTSAYNTSNLLLLYHKQKKKIYVGYLFFYKGKSYMFFYTETENDDFFLLAPLSQSISLETTFCVPNTEIEYCSIEFSKVSSFVDSNISILKSDGDIYYALCRT